MEPAVGRVGKADQHVLAGRGGQRRSLVRLRDAVVDAVDQEVGRIELVETDIVAAHAGIVIELVPDRIDVVEHQDRLRRIGRSHGDARRFGGRLGIVGIVQVLGIAAVRARRDGIDDQHAIHAHLEVKDRVLMAVVQIRAGLMSAPLIGIAALDFEGGVTDPVVHRGGLDAVPVDGMRALGRLELAMEDLALLDPDYLGRPGRVAAGNVGVLEPPELQLRPVLHIDVPVGHLPPHEDLPGRPVGRRGIVLEGVAAEGIELQRIGDRPVKCRHGQHLQGVQGTAVPDSARPAPPSSRSNSGKPVSGRRIMAASRSLDQCFNWSPAVRRYASRSPAPSDTNRPRRSGKSRCGSAWDSAADTSPETFSKAQAAHPAGR